MEAAMIFAKTSKTRLSSTIMAAPLLATEVLAVAAFVPSISRCTM
jgi:hypothetical protein